MTFMTEDIVEVDPKTETISCDGGEDGLGPVSYTHLTLPTICSV